MRDAIAVKLDSAFAGIVAGQRQAHVAVETFEQPAQIRRVMARERRLQNQDSHRNNQSKETSLKASDLPSTDRSATSAMPRHPLAGERGVCAK